MKKILHNQGYQLLAALVLAGLVWIVGRGMTLEGAWLGVSSAGWLILAVVFPILHQFYVVFCWRGELYHGWLSRHLGENAIRTFGAGFMVLFLARPLTVMALGIANQGTLPIPLGLNLPLLLICLAILGNLGFSFVRYFGFRRALGEDHFSPDIYRSLPFVRQGIFQWSSNAMYVYGFLALWCIGLIFQSQAALLAAAFNHLFIWAHYFFTEKPDMETIYGKD